MPRSFDSQGKIARPGRIPPAKEPRTATSYAVVAVCGFLVLAIALVYVQTAHHDFVQFDDPDYVCENPAVASGVTARGIVWAFTQVHASNWHPLTWLSHMADCRIFSLKYPGGHHLTNVVLHAVSAVLLFLVLREMTGDLWPSAFAATLFAVHPLHVESVAWVAERKDVLSGLFFMLTLAAYIGYVRHSLSLLRYLTVTLLFALGLMSKPMLVTLPFVLLLLDYWPLRRKDLLHLILEKLPWLALTIASCAVTQFAQQKLAAASLKDCPLAWRVANVVVSYVVYLRQFIDPRDLAAFYPHPQNTLPIATIVCAALLLAGISVAVVACRRSCPSLLVGWAWYLGMLVPVIGLVQVGYQGGADRYSYLPQIGLYVAAGWGGAHVFRNWLRLRGAVAITCALAVTGLTCCAWQQASYWKDNEAIWRHTVACTSNNSLARVNLAAALAQRGEFQEATDQCREALKIDSRDAKAHALLAAIFAQRGEFPQAIDHWQEAVNIEPGDAESQVRLATVLAQRGEFEAAIGHFQKVLEIRPNDAKVHANLGAVMARCGQIDDAITHFQKALDLMPNDVYARRNLDAALSERERRKSRPDPPRAQ
jgi:protein O-mannosyl-transferase